MTVQLEQRLSEAFDALWDDFVDPREAFTDMDGQWWSAVGSVNGTAPGIGTHAITEQQLRELRNQCRGLAMANEFAINGHENRISYIVGPGHSYRATVCKGMEAEPELALAVQKVLERFQRTLRTELLGEQRQRTCRAAGVAAAVLLLWPTALLAVNLLGGGLHHFVESAWIEGATAAALMLHVTGTLWIFSLLRTRH